MKHIPFVLLLAIGLFSLGCDGEDPKTITGPGALGPKALEFRGMVKSAGVSEFSEGMEVSGRVYYSINPITLEKGASLFYDIELETEAEVRHPQDTETPGNSYRAAGNSVDRISIDANSRTAVLSKAYRIEGMESVAYLNVAFSVSGLDLSFGRAWISTTAE